MKKNRKEFNVLQDEEKRNSSWNEFVGIIKDAPIDILGVYFNDEAMSKLYEGNSHSNYDIGFYALLDNYVHYLKSKDAYGQICIESRTLKENTYLTSLGFIIKGDNCIGLQIADIVPSQLLRYERGIKNDFHKLAKT